ncbi:hypothetical protein FJO69_01255 [[Mycoplasma] falconis]|uniref:Uncharacterized protein n=1 Tax=[Mycoplasma] falconis TaxID=92403 RepID=A0A501XB14_9BACT|nr:hypothetical protein [[Mycoplasma] falconis]TPE57543.1 hypothetical protein FJO69_01255 [[Mycoplasma] falconis]
MSNLENNEKEFDLKISEIEKLRYSDPLKAIYVIDEAKKQFAAKNEQQDLDTLRELVLIEIKKKNLKTQTSLDTLSLINSLKNKKMDYAFMLIYNELKAREDLAKYASEFQYFFNEEGFDASGFQTLIYDLLSEANIDWEYKIQGKTINPSKLGSFLKNQDILKMQNEIINSFYDDVAKNKIARQVFAAYLFQNWIDILLNKTNEDYENIINVVKVLYGEQKPEGLSEKAQKLYEVFK